MKLTPWFPGTVKPVRVGVYERKYRNGWRAYCSWTGKAWSSPSSAPKEAAMIKFSRSANQNVSWRGVLK